MMQPPAERPSQPPGTARSQSGQGAPLPDSSTRSRKRMKAPQQRKIILHPSKIMLRAEERPRSMTVGWGAGPPSLSILDTR